jgi:hypothetical protein
MGVISAFRTTARLDPRWSGRVQSGPFLLLPVAGLTFFFLLITFIGMGWIWTHLVEPGPPNMPFE